MLQRQLQHTGTPQHYLSSISSSETSLPKPRLNAIRSDSLNTSTTSLDKQRQMSPPTTIPLSREAASILTDNILHRSGGSTPSSSSALKNQPAAEPPKDANVEDKSGWSDNVMAQDSGNGRNRFVEFMRDRQMRYKQMNEHDEIQVIDRVIHTPGHWPRNVQSNNGMRPESFRLPSTPTTRNVFDHYDVDLRQAAKRRRMEQENISNMEEEEQHTVNMELTMQRQSQPPQEVMQKEEEEQQHTVDMELTTQRETRKEQEVIQGEDEQHTVDMELTMRREIRREQTEQFEYRPLTAPPNTDEQIHTGTSSIGGAYEFSQIFPANDSIYNMDRLSTGHEGGVGNASFTSAESSNLNLSMISGSSGQVRKRFSLQYFPSSFQVPPGSSQLTRVYNLFAERPGELLSADDVVALAEDCCNRDNVRIFLDMLTRKQYLKKIEHRWRLRQ